MLKSSFLSKMVSKRALYIRILVSSLDPKLFDLFKFNYPLIQFSKTFSAFYVSLGQNDLALCQKYHKVRLSSISADD